MRTCPITDGNVEDNFLLEIWLNFRGTVATVCRWSGQKQNSSSNFFRALCKKGKDSPYSITEHRVPELIPVLGSQPASDVSHKPRPVVTQFRCIVNRGTMGVNSLPKTVIRQRRGCDSNPGPFVHESSTLTTQLPSHPIFGFCIPKSY